MGYAINTQGGLRAIESADDLLEGEIWHDERPSPSVAIDKWAEYQVQAQAALESTSTTVERIIEAVALGDTTLEADDVVAYMKYRRDLRAILSQSPPDAMPESLPERPPYPANT